MPEPTSEQWQAIEDELYTGRKIAAIKLFREAVGCDLKTAKDTLDRHEQVLRERDPEKFITSKSGCGSAVLILAVSLACLTWIIN